MHIATHVRASVRAILLGGVAVTALSLPAAAQDDGEEKATGNVIVVSATKRDSTIQDVPFSINAQTQESIEKSGAINLEDISRNVAGLSVQNLGPGQSQVSVRGVSAGQIVRDQPGVKEQVGVYLDESVISLSLFTPDLDLFDLNRVETLRGPQGTLFGSGSVGGTIRYITNQPRMGITEGQVEGNVNIIGDDTGYHLKGAVNVPLGDNVAARAVGYYTRYGGYIDALGPAAEENVNSGERLGGRLALRFEGEGFSVTPRVIYQKIEADGFNRQEIYNLYYNEFESAPKTFNEREQYLLLPEAFEDETLIADLVAEVELGPVVLTSVTSYTDRSILVSRDASALTGSVSVDVGLSNAGINLPSNLRDTTDVEAFTQEIRLASDYDSPLQWVLGAFYSETDRFYRQRLPTPGYAAELDAATAPGTSAGAANGFNNLDSPYNADLPYNLKQFAIFGEGTYAVTDAFDITIGARWYDYEEERSFTSGGFFSGSDNRTDTTTSDGFSPRVLLSYDVNEDLTLNAQVSKGFRLGGVNDPLNVNLCDNGQPNGPDRQLFGGFQNYDDETLWNYEVGAKMNGDGFYANVAGFYNDIQNLQVTLDAGTCSSRIVFNVPEAHTLGAEAEAGFSLAPGLDVVVSGSLIEAEFDTTLPAPLTTATGIREGNRLPSVPRFQLSATGSYEFALDDSTDAYVALSYSYVGNRYTQPADQENNPRNFVHGLPFNGAPANATTQVDLLLPYYELVNISAGIDLPSDTSFVFYVNNLFDQNALLSFDRERGGRARLAYRVSQPRTFGVTARQKF